MRFRRLSGVPLPVEQPETLASIPRVHLATCFGCGPDNDACLGIVAEFTDDKVIADLRFHPRFEGGPGLVHGGATAAFFDDLIGYVMTMHRTPAVTANLSVDYRKPIRLGETVRGEAWMTKADGRKLFCEAAGFDADGNVLVEVTALFLRVGADHFTKVSGGDATPYPSDMYSDEEYYP